MKIAVLNYESGNVDIVSISRAFIMDRFGGNIEPFLVEYLGYNSNNIQWMTDVSSIRIIDSDTINQIT